MKKRPHDLVRAAWQEYVAKGGTDPDVVALAHVDSGTLRLETRKRILAEFGDVQKLFGVEMSRILEPAGDQAIWLIIVRGSGAKVERVEKMCGAAGDGTEVS